MADLARSEIRQPHQGMPPLDTTGKQISFFEFWPPRYFYAPMFLYWLWLTLRHGGRFTLPTISNPLFPMGGWIGESAPAKPASVAHPVVTPATPVPIVAVPAGTPSPSPIDLLTR